MIKKIKIAFGVLITILIISLIGILISNTIALKNNQIGSFFGYSISYVPTASMEPAISSGDTVLIKKGSIEDVEVGDIIVYFDGSKYVIHRAIKEVDENIFQTQGDNEYTNPIPDSVLVTANNYYGKYIKTVNYLNIQSLVKNKNYIFPLCILVFLIVLVTEAISLAKTLAKKTRENLKKADDDKLREELRKEVLKEIEESKKLNNDKNDK